MMKNYYELLEISTDAAEEEIRNALKKFKIKWQQREASHDINVRHEAEMMMREALEIQQTLLDNVKKEQYDKEKVGQKSTYLGVIEDEGKDEAGGTSKGSSSGSSKGRLESGSGVRSGSGVSGGGTNRANGTGAGGGISPQTMEKILFFYETNEYEQMKIVIRDVIGDDPNNTDLLSYYGYSFFMTNDNSTAEKSLNKAVSIDPTRTGWAMSLLTQIYFREHKKELYKKTIAMLRQYEHYNFYFRLRFLLEERSQVMTPVEYLEMAIECPMDLFVEHSSFKSNENNSKGLVEYRIRINVEDRLSEIQLNKAGQFDIDTEINRIRILERKLKQVPIDFLKDLRGYNGQASLVEYYIDELLKAYNSKVELTKLNNLKISGLSEGIDRRIAFLNKEIAVEKKKTAATGKILLITLVGAFVSYLFLVKHYRANAMLLPRDIDLGVMFGGQITAIFQSPYSLLIALGIVSIVLVFWKVYKESISFLVIPIIVLVFQFLNTARLVSIYHRGVNGIGDGLDIIVISALSAGFVAIVIGIPAALIQTFIISPIIKPIAKKLL